MSASVYAEDNSGVTAKGAVDKDCDVVMEQLRRTGQAKSSEQQIENPSQPSGSTGQTRSGE